MLARILHDGEYVDVVLSGRKQRATGYGRRHLPEGSAGLPDASGIENHKTRRSQAADAVRVQGRHLQLFSMAEVRIWLQREEGQALHIQLAAVSRKQAKRDAGLCHLGAVRDRKKRQTQAGHRLAGRLWLQHLFYLDRNLPRAYRQEAGRSEERRVGKER